MYSRHIKSQNIPPHAFKSHTQKTAVMINQIFADKRQTTILMLLWLTVAVTIYASCANIEENEFLHMGPSNSTKIMGVVIDSWAKWYTVSVLAFVKTGMNEFIGDSIGPWVINTIQDEKTKMLPYSKRVCILIVEMYTVYSHVMAVFGLALMLSQIDFLIVRVMADMIVTAYSLNRFMANKTVDAKYKELDEVCEKCVPEKQTEE